MATSIPTTLGLGSGVDTVALVKSLVDAQFAGKTATLTKKSDALTAQVSAVSELKSGITGFASALSSLVKSGTLGTQLTSSSAAVRATALPGATVTGINAQIAVGRLASAQVAAMRTGIAATDPVGTGSLTFEIGTLAGNGLAEGKTTKTIEIGAQDGASLQTVANRINAENVGVTASVITDASGQRLVFKGATGDAKAFTVTAQEGAVPGLSRLNVGFTDSETGAQITSRAANAEFTVDGVAVSRDTNSVTGVILGVRLELQGLTGTTPAAIGTTAPTDALSQAVNDFATTFNEMLAIGKKATDPITGSLRSDSAAATLMRSLASLTLTPLTQSTDGSPRTLAEIGIATNRDGTLRVDTAQLTKALADHPAALEAMFVSGTGASGRGLSAALNAISLSATSTTTGLGASEARYAKAKATLADEQAKLTEQSTSATTRMTQQFAASEARVAAYKSTMTFMENQIKAWNRES